MPLLASKQHTTLLSISDSDRCKGLYLLGLPRMGKSTLAVTLALNDIENGHGIFFLDPEGSAIDDIINHCSSDSLTKRHYLLLDPANNTHAFGLNPLQCTSIDDAKERNDTYKKAKGIFDKLWKDTFEDKPWLQLILQNALYALIENQGFTLAELPLFFTDVSFRNYICSNIKYNLAVKNYWINTFASKSRQTQEDQIQAAETRAETLLAHPYVYDILAQTEPTLDFDAILEQRKIVLVRLSSRLSYETRKIIGTVLISELLHAIEGRQTRNQFCIFIDEFQTFAAYEDMPVLITQAPKYAIATTLIHHERYGQLLDDPLLMGATGAIANKVLFQTTARDAGELAPEYAEKPPTTKRREQELAISQEPVDYLLSRGHGNHDICEFANRVIRPMKEALSDTRDEMEGERLIRMDLLDEVALARLDERIDWLGESRGRYSSAILGKAMADVAAARQGTGRMQELLASTQSLKRILRAIDRALSAIMQGKTGQGKEDFSQFLIGLAQEFNRVPAGIDKVLELYISVCYGDIALPRAIPFDLSERQNLFSEERKVLREALTARETKDRSELSKTFLEKAWTAFYESRDRQTQLEKWWAEGERIAVSRLIKHFIAPWHIAEKRSTWSAYGLYFDFALIQCFREVRRLIEPYLHCEFEGHWKTLITKDWHSQRSIARLIAEIENGFDPHIGGGGSYAQTERLKKGVMRDLFRFLGRYREGAFVALALLDAAQTSGWRSWRKSCGYYEKMRFFEGLRDSDKEELNVINAARHLYDDSYRLSEFAYENVCMSDFPGIVGVEPIEYLHLIKKLNEVLSSLRFDNLLVRYYNTWDNAWERGSDGSVFGIDKFSLELREKREDVRERESRLEKESEWFARERPEAAKAWRKSDGLTKEYLLGRACDLMRYDEEVASVTFPEPGREDLKRCASSLLWFFKEIEARDAKQKEQREEEEARARIGKECEGALIKVSHAPPAAVIDRPLSAEERNAVVAACEKEIGRSDRARNMLAIVRQFAAFCGLLAKPENNIRVPSGQYIEVETPLRTEADMAGEIVRELTRLPEYTAYASIMQNGNKWRGKITTRPLPDLVDKKTSRTRQEYISSMTLAYLASRQDIIKEVSIRQASWRRESEPPPVHS